MSCSGLLAAAHAAQERHDLALEEFQHYESLYGEPVPWFRGYLHGLAGSRDEAKAVLAEVERRVARGESQPVEPAQIYLGLGEYDRSIEVLEQAPAAGVSFQPYLWPEYETLFPNPRFRAVLAKFGLPLPS